MSGLFPKVSKIPAAPGKDDAAVTEAARQRKLQILAGGRAATNLTSSQGDTTTPNIVKSSLGGY